MTDNEITKTSDEIHTLSGKIKAIYPHIVVGGSILKPYYSIEWYDVEKETMIRGYSSFSLPFVYKWLQEDFEVVDDDIDNLIDRQKAVIKKWKRVVETWVEQHEKDTATIENYESCLKSIENIKTEAVKEFAELLKEHIRDYHPYYYVIDEEVVDNLVEEMVGEKYAPCN